MIIRVSILAILLSVVGCSEQVEESRNYTVTLPAELGFSISRDGQDAVYNTDEQSLYVSPGSGPEVITFTNGVVVTLLHDAVDIDGTRTSVEADSRVVLVEQDGKLIIQSNG